MIEHRIELPTFGMLEERTLSLSTYELAQLRTWLMKILQELNGGPPGDRSSIAMELMDWAASLEAMDPDNGEVTLLREAARRLA